MNPNALDSQPTTEFLDLNDDCLLIICQYFTVGEALDLLGLFNSCRFDALLHRRIAQLKHLRISLRDYHVYNTDQLKVIGGNLKSFTFSAGYSVSDERVLHLLQPLCASGAGAALQTLTLNYVHFQTEYVDCIGLVAPQLTTLDLSYCQLQDALLKPLLQQCLKLRTLKLLANYTLVGLSLSAVNTNVLRVLEVELHGLWAFDVAALHEQHPQISVLAYNRGRSSRTIYGDSSCFK